VIAATNRPNVLDKAILRFIYTCLCVFVYLCICLCVIDRFVYWIFRSGRFDLHIQIPLPDLAGRECILQIHLRKVKLSPSLDVIGLSERIAKETDSWTGADLASLVNEVVKSCLVLSCFALLCFALSLGRF
jgi:ATP-dependent 26S proteasome regulatory subunit